MINMDVDANELVELAKPELYSLLFDNLSVNYSIIDVNGNYVDRNVANYHNISQKLANANEIDPVTWADCVEVMKNRRQVIKEEFFRGRLYLSIKQPVIKNNQSIGIIVLSIDITEQKQAELAKNEFLLNMQHDLRTPFSGLLSISSMLYEKETDNTKKQFQGLVVQSASRLLQLLDQILELSQLGDNPISYSHFNIQQAVSEIIELLNAEIQMKGLSLSVECPESDIYTDRMRFNRILLNLLGNAVKFTSLGEIDVKVIVNDSLSLTVKDTGVGIPKDKIDFIFDKFAKLKLSNTEQSFKGSGVGLYIVKQFVDDLGGSVKVKSKPGKGSSFTVSFPVKGSSLNFA